MVLSLARAPTAALESSRAQSAMTRRSSMSTVNLATAAPCYIAEVQLSRKPGFVAVCSPDDLLLGIAPDRSIQQ